MKMSDKFDEEEFRVTKEELSEKFNQEASDRDIKWAIYNKHAIKHISEKNWGLYRNDKLDMAELLIQENKHEKALKLLFEIVLLDLNGVNNAGGFDHIARERLNILEFDPQHSFLAKGIIRYIETQASKLKLDKNALKKLFLETITKKHMFSGMTVNPSEAWSNLEKNIFVGK